MELYLLSADENLSGIIVKRSGKHFHESRFSGTILADQCMNLTGLYVETYGIDCYGSGKLLADVLHFYGLPQLFSFTHCLKTSFLFSKASEAVPDLPLTCNPLQPHP